jgi:hypothetical protein
MYVVQPAANAAGKVGRRRNYTTLHVLRNCDGEMIFVGPDHVHKVRCARPTLRLLVGRKLIKELGDVFRDP